MDWCEYWSIEPFGEEWRQTAVIASVAAAPYSKTRLPLETFMPNTPPRKSPRQLATMFSQYVLARRATLARVHARKQRRLKHAR